MWSIKMVGGGGWGRIWPGGGGGGCRGMVIMYIVHFCLGSLKKSI
jgi:hypothetical protein